MKRGTYPLVYFGKRMHGYNFCSLIIRLCHFRRYDPYTRFEDYITKKAVPIKTVLLFKELVNTSILGDWQSYLVYNLRILYDVINVPYCFFTQDLV